MNPANRPSSRYFRRKYRGPFIRPCTVWLAFTLLSFSAFQLAQAQEVDFNDFITTDHAAEDEAAQRAAEESDTVVQQAAPLPPPPEDYDIFGVWDPTVIAWPHVAVSAANLPDGRILTWASNKPNAFPGGQPEYTYATVWNPADGSFLDVSLNGHDMFCSHQVVLEDGRIFVAGGRNHVKTTSVFDSATNQWLTLSDQMNNGRWYPTSVAMGDGAVFMALGSSGGQYPEIWRPGAGWNRLSSVDLTFPVIQYDDGRFYEAIWWPFFSLKSDGDIAHFGPTPRTHNISTQDSGTIVDTGPLGASWYPKHGAYVMYDEGKVLVAGGAQNGTTQTSVRNAMTIDISGAEPVINNTASMHYPRKFQNAVMLADGKVMMVGGNTNGFKFNDAAPVYYSESWDPQTGQWKLLAPQKEERTYHSVALLMTDGRVWSAGGGLCGGCAVNHLNAEVYSPPYLFNADGSPAPRPQILNAPESAGHGEVLSVTATPGLTRFSLIKMGSTTHQMNTDQRFMSPSFVENSGTTSSVYDIQLHSNPNVLTAGPYMLFGLNSSGTPSVAAVVTIRSGSAMSNYPPSLVVDRVSGLRVDVPVTIGVHATDIDDNSITYTATGLPPGLSIDAVNGDISGIPTEIGTYTVEITATDARGASDTEIVVWTVGDASGLRYDYYTGAWSALPNFDALTPQYSGIVENITLSVATAADDFGLRFRGKIRILTAGTYTFHLTSDDGSRLLIDNSVLINNDGLHAVRTVSGSRNLSVGYHDIEVQYFERTGQATLILEYAGPGITRTAVPVDVLYVDEPVENRPPVLVGTADRTTNVGQNVSLAMSATDPDGDQLSWSATGLPPGLSINSSTGLITGAANSVGVHGVTVTVTDVHGASDQTSFNWTVVQAGELVIDPIVVPSAQINTSVTFVANVSGGINPTLVWEFGDSSMPTAPSSQTSVSHTYTEAGRFLVKVTATGEDGETTSQYFVQNIHLALQSGEPQISSSIVYQDLSGAADRVWNVNPDNGSVTVHRVDTNVKLAEIPTGQEPMSLAIAGDGRVWVTNRDSDTISIIDSSMAVAQTLHMPYGSQPHGIVRDPVNGGFWVVLAGTGEVARLSNSGSISSRISIGGELRNISLSADGRHVYAPKFITPMLPGEGTTNVQVQDGTTHFGGEVIRIAVSGGGTSTIVLRHSARADAENAGRGIPNYLGPVVLSPDGTRGWVPSKQDNILRGTARDGQPLDHDNTVRAISSVIDLAANAERYVDRIDHDDAGMPVSGIFGPDGIYLYVAMEGSRQIAMIDAHSRLEIERIEVGRAPMGVALSPDGAELFVHNYMDRSVTRLNVGDVVSTNSATAETRNTWQTVSNEILGNDVLLGKQFFHDAADARMANQLYISCASCHVDGGHDGRTWDFTNFGEGLRNTIDLRGRRGMGHGRLHWSANFDEVQDFEGQIRSLAHGLGLMTDAQFNTGSRSEPLGDPKAGVSADLDRLAAYVASLSEYPRSPNRDADGSFTSQGLTGRDLFTTKGCNVCHSGSDLTDSAQGLLHDIGTILGSSGGRLGGALSGIDTPTLRGVWTTGPYLHDGRAETLQAAIAAHNDVNLSSVELDALAAYLAQLEGPDSDPSGGCGAPDYDIATDAAFFVWQDCGGVTHLLLSGGGTGINAEGSVVATQNFTLSGTQRIESNDVVQIADSRIDFTLVVGGAWDDEIYYQIPAGASACFSMTSLTAGVPVLAGRDRTQMSGAFDPATLQPCDEPPPPECGEPQWDALVDRALIVWHECDGTVRIVGAGGTGSASYSGRVAATQPFVTTGTDSIESSDSVVFGSTDINFDISLGGGWTDGLHYQLPDGAESCLDVSSQSTGTVILAGRERMQMTSAFNPITLEACSIGTTTCGEPQWDSSTDKALVVWQDCDGTVNVVGAGGGQDASYAGQVSATANFTSTEAISIESSDIFVDNGDSIDFSLSLGGIWTDAFRYTLPGGASSCLSVTSQSSGSSILAGPDRQTMTGPFDPATLLSCTPGETSCGDLQLDTAVDTGLFVWQSCDRRWHVVGTGLDGASGTSYTGSIASSNGFSEITAGRLEASDTLSTDLAGPLQFSISTGYPWDDSFSFVTPVGSSLCITLTDMSAGVQAHYGLNKTVTGLSFDPETGGACQ